MLVTTPGRMEVTIRVNQMPSFELVENGWKRFHMDCDGKIIVATVRPKMFKKFEEAAAQYPYWIATVTGKVGSLTGNGFVLDSPSIQAFERKMKADPQVGESSEPQG